MTKEQEKELIGLVDLHTECLRAQESFNEGLVSKVKELIDRIEKLEKDKKIILTDK